MIIRQLDNSFLLMPMGGLPLPEIIDNGLFEGGQRGVGVESGRRRERGGFGRAIK